MCGRSLTLGNEVFESLKRLGIVKQVISITTDNASNNNTLIQTLRSRFSTLNFIFNAVDSHIRCLPHILNLAAQGFLNVFNDHNFQIY